MFWLTPTAQGTLGWPASKKVTRLFKFYMLMSDWSFRRFVFGNLSTAFGPLGPLTGLSRDFELEADPVRVPVAALVSIAP